MCVFPLTRSSGSASTLRLQKNYERFDGPDVKKNNERNESVIVVPTFVFDQRLLYVVCPCARVSRAQNEDLRSFTVESLQGAVNLTEDIPILLGTLLGPPGCDFSLEEWGSKATCAHKLACRPISCFPAPA